MAEYDTPDYASSQELRPDRGGTNESNAEDTTLPKKRGNQMLMNMIKNAPASSNKTNVQTEADFSLNGDDDSEDNDSMPNKTDVIKSKKPVLGKPKKKAVVRTTSETCTLRDFPKSVVTHARHEINNSSLPQTDSILAYIYSISGGAIEVSDDIKSVAEKIENPVQDAIISTDRRIKNLEKKLNEQNKLLNEVMNMLALVTADRFDFIRTANSPNAINLDQTPLHDLKKAVREQTKELMDEQARREGRPIR